MRIVYENKKPKFAIGKDRHQWILCYEKGSGKLKEKWTAFSYHPNLSNLLDSLAEDMFKNYTHKLNEIKNLDKSISRVYGLITNITNDLEHMVLRGRNAFSEGFSTKVVQDYL